MSRCRSCDTPIRWAYTEKGHRIPLDLEPTPEGNIILRGTAAIAHVVVGQVPTDPPLYISHFVTCPNAAQHRRRR